MPEQEKPSALTSYIDMLEAGARRHEFETVAIRVEYLLPLIAELRRLREVEAAARDFLILVEDAACGESHVEREWNAREDALRTALKGDRRDG